MRTIITAIGLATAIGLVSAPALAYRPFDSTDADVAERGEFELELGPIGYLYGPGGHDLVLSQVVANFGIARGWELVVQGRVPLALSGGTPPFVIDDTGVFIKHVLKRGTLQGRRGVSVAFEAGILPPQVTGDGAGFTVDHILSYRWSRLTAHLNLQVALTTRGHLDLFGGLVLEGPHAWRARPVAELVVEDETSTRLTLSALAGVIIRVRDDLSLDLAGRVARVDVGNGPQLGAEVRAGLTVTFDAHLPR